MSFQSEVFIGRNVELGGWRVKTESTLPKGMHSKGDGL